MREYKKVYEMNRHAKKGGVIKSLEMKNDQKHKKQIRNMNIFPKIWKDTTILNLFITSNLHNLQYFWSCCHKSHYLMLKVSLFVCIFNEYNLAQVVNNVWQGDLNTGFQWCSKVLKGLNVSDCCFCLIHFFCLMQRLNIERVSKFI